MPPNPPETISPLEVLKQKANFYMTMARLYFREWLRHHRKLLLLSACERYQFFTKQCLEVNQLILKDLHFAPLRECVEDVVSLQKLMRSSGQQFYNMVSMEKKHDKEFWALARYVAGTLEREKADGQGWNVC